MPDVATLNAVWEDSELALKGIAKAGYRGGEFTEVSGTTATIVFPNEAHRANCAPKQGEVEAALSQRFGLAISLVLRSADGGSPPARASSSSGNRAPAPDPEPDDDVPLAIAEVRDLPDAPSAATGGIDALTEAFPGAEFVE